MFLHIFFFPYKLVTATLLSCIMSLYYYLFFGTLCVFTLPGESDIKNGTKGDKEKGKRKRLPKKTNRAEKISAALSSDL